MNVTGSLPNHVLSSVGNAPASSQTTAVYKTNTLEQYGGMGRNMANNVNAIVNQSMIGASQQPLVGHHRNNPSNLSANVAGRGMTGINMMNYSILQSELD